MTDGRRDDAGFTPETRPRRRRLPLGAATAVLVARTNVRRALRRALARPRRTGLLVVFVVGSWASLLLDGSGGPPGPGGFDTLSDAVAFGTYAQGGAAVAWLGAVVLSAVGATTRLADVDGASLVVPAAGVRATFLGTLAAEHARRFAFVGLLAAATVVSVAVRGGGVASLPTGGVAALCVFVTAELVGHVLALTWVETTGGDVFSPGVRLLAAGAALMGATLLALRLDTVVTLLAETPLGWYGDLFLLGTPASGRPAFAAAALLGSVAVAPPLYLWAERLARRTWFRDPPAPGAGGSRGAAVADTILTPFADERSRAVARRVWLQTVRRPKTLVFLGIPLLFAGTVLVSGDYPPAFPVVLGLYGAWAAGVGTTLNPLSSEGAGLPLLLASPLAGGGVVRGYVLAAASVAVPAVAGTVLVAGPLAGFGPGVTLAGVVAGVGLTVGTAPLSVAIGVGVPRLRGLGPADAEGPLTPSKTALAVHSVAVVALSLPSVAGVALAARFGPAALWLGVGATVALAALGGAVGYRYAAARFGSLTLG
ncbi:hypothetical protein [Halobaculum sp. MBLA0143]|uniref:hypothetical protein n=1 Tax=Halobaculum sp. MBLA0143 TaxID=3079933 RepID=UPI0035250B9D